MAATLKLAIPIMAGMVGQMLLGIADTVMVGRVGVVPLAAASLVNTICHIPLVFGIGILSAISVLTAQKFGAKKTQPLWTKVQRFKIRTESPPLAMMKFPSELLFGFFR